MKLKKIASLAAAGMMAVSMLTACNTTSNQPEEPTNPIEPGTNGVSNAVEARLTTAAPEYVTFKDDADLDDALEYAVEYAGVQTVLPGYVELEKLTDWNGTKVHEVLADEVGDDLTDNVNISNIGDTDVLQAAENVDSYQIEDEVAVELYVVSSAIGENAVNQMIANDINDDIASYEYSTRGDAVWADGGNYNHEYTVSVSTYTKTVNSSVEGGFLGGIGHIDGAADPSLTFVAVQVVRTATHQ